MIAGASLAGLRAAEQARHLGHRGPILVVGEEHRPPYDRPPLSKQVLAGEWSSERIQHHAPDKLDTLGLELLLGTRARSLDVGSQILECGDGRRLRYDGLVLATGATPRPMPGTEGMAEVSTLRTLDDCLAIRARLESAGPGARLVVVGAGFIGSEVAATCHRLGSRVTVVEALPTPLGRVLGEAMGEACAGLHRAAGVELRTGVGVERVVADPGGPSPAVVHLADGTALEADVVVVGIGVVPAVAWLEGSGVVLDDGVVCDEFLFAADRVVAAGDLARWHHPSSGGLVRIEHWTNAAEGGAAAAHNLVAGPGAARPYDPVPFFWSDQYGTKIQVLGLPGPDDDVEVVAGSPGEGKLVALYRRSGRLQAALAFNHARRLMSYRPLLAAGASFEEALSLDG